jgi:hypothetical protein
MLQIQLLILFTLGMEVDPTDAAVALVEANVIEPFEACTIDCLDAVVGNQEVLFPAHENVFALLVVLQCKGR